MDDPAVCAIPVGPMAVFAKHLSAHRADGVSNNFKFTGAIRQKNCQYAGQADISVL